MCSKKSDARIEITNYKLQIFSWFWQWNNFEDRLIFDEVKAYQKIVPFLGHPVCATARLNILSLRSLNANHFNRYLLIAASLKTADLLTLETIGAYR